VYGSGPYSSAPYSSQPMAEEGAIELVVQDATVGLSAESPVLTQANTLAVQDALVALGAENVVLEVGITLEVQDALVGLTAESPALTQANTLEVQDALITLEADNVTLTDVTGAPAPPVVDTWSPGGGGFRVSSRRWKAIERELKRAMERPEKPRRIQKPEPEAEPARAKPRAIEEPPIDREPEPPTPIEERRKREGRGRLKPVRYVVTYATFSPKGGGNGRPMPARRVARMGQLEPAAIQNPTLEEVYLATVLT
jgi:hypothetical protein